MKYLKESEAYDISNIMEGILLVLWVVFQDGKPRKIVIIEDLKLKL